MRGVQRKSVSRCRLVVEEGYPKNSVFLCRPVVLGSRKVCKEEEEKEGVSKEWWSAPVVIGSRKVCEGVSKEWWSAPVVIGSGVVQCKGAQIGPVAIGSRKSVWRPRGDW
jgi:hypothetical protein